MPLCRARWGLLLALLSVLWPFVARAADLPTADQILQIHRENRERLARLHLQVVHRLETTEACCRQIRNELKELADEADRPYFNGECFFSPSRSIQEIRADADTLIRFTTPQKVLRPMEIFLNGDDHQYRQPSRPFPSESAFADWAFSNAPVTVETLRSHYHDQILFSYANRSGQSWRRESRGCASPDRLDQVVNVSLPPFASALTPSWHRMHPYDLFFSAGPSAYRVVRVEELEGQSLIVVDVTIRVGGRRGDDLNCRAWLDLKSGALPVKMYFARWSEGFERMRNLVFDRFPPTDVVLTREVRALENGAFYPSDVVLEHFKHDPTARELSGEEILDIADGKRKLPLAVFYRETWTCTRVEIKTDYPADFFVLPVAQSSESDVH
jgi:hypothetical protein